MEILKKDKELYINFLEITDIADKDITFKDFNLYLKDVLDSNIYFHSFCNEIKSKYEEQVEDIIDKVALNFDCMLNSSDIKELKSELIKGLLIDIKELGTMETLNFKKGDIINTYLGNAIVLDKENANALLLYKNSNEKKYIDVHGIKYIDEDNQYNWESEKIYNSFMEYKLNEHKKASLLEKAPTSKSKEYER